jgi:hypothetical protein
VARGLYRVGKLLQRVSSASWMRDMADCSLDPNIMLSLPRRCVVFTRAAGIAGIAALGLACGGGPTTSPFFLWTLRPGMPVGSVEDFVIKRFRPSESDTAAWERCDSLSAGARRCERMILAPYGRLQVIAASDGRVLYLAFAPQTRDRAFDDSLTAMQREWLRGEKVRADPHGVSEEHPKGIAEMRSGRWRAFMTFDGKVCYGTTRPCPALIQLVDWGAGGKYVDMSVAK